MQRLLKLSFSVLFPSTLMQITLVAALYTDPNMSPSGFSLQPSQVILRMQLFSHFLRNPRRTQK